MEWPVFTAVALLTPWTPGSFWLKSCLANKSFVCGKMKDFPQKTLWGREDDASQAAVEEGHSE